MKNFDILLEEYNVLKEKYKNEKSLNLKEDLKNKLIELDYSFNKSYEDELDTSFPMATTLDKEKKRLESLIDFVLNKTSFQRNLVNEYKDLTNDKIELSYLKYSENINLFKDRLDNVNNILSLLNDAKDSSKKNLIKNKLLKKEYLNLLYEFCLIDNLDIKEINLNSILDKKDNTQGVSLKKQEIPKEEKKQELKEEKKEEVQEEKILTTMPQIDKIGSVVPVNVFDSLENASNKLPNVVLPTNGIKDNQNEIFLDTKDMFK